MILRLRTGSETLILGPRAEFASFAALAGGALASEYEVRRRLRIALADPEGADALRRAFGRWREEGARIREADDRALIDRIARMSRNGTLAAFVVADRSERLAGMSLKERIATTLRLVPNHLTGATKQEFAALVEPKALATTVEVLAIWAVSHAFGAGEAIDAVLLAVGLYFGGPQLWRGLHALFHALELMGTASSRVQLDEAAAVFADGVAKLGVVVLIAALTHGAAKKAARWTEKKPGLRNTPPEKAPKAERYEERPAEKKARIAPRTEAERIAAIADEASVATPKDKAVFYSGEGNRKKALAAAERGSVPIDKTECGRALEAENLYSEANELRNRTADGYWTRASQRFAENASGDVTAYVHGASPDRVFAQTELPVLLENRKVTSINGMPTQLLRSMEENSPGSAFRAIEGMAPQ
ncbi:hypothetical protein IY145_08910 [Methylosinus sp. H3A]|uniref:hypothetical protein n=1 Tax=Methylosinus sp. H3A TaxID=2785786 RepID=UPI0018C211D8|nr:hypothetical protein [Methylosinus sp. H3A]MBG0809498.1 hypothetical protein [Methylosinus sp. H3A]